MTGYGCGESSHEGGKLVVEVSSVNRKQSEIAINLPRDLEVLEPRMREEINRHVSRGRVTVRVAFHAGDERKAGSVRINKLLAKELGIEGRITLDTLLRAPGVLETDEEVGDAEAYWPAVEGALKEAMGQLVRMRIQEGGNLKQDLAARLALMRRAASAVRERAPAVADHYRRQLHERIAAAGITLTAEDQERLLKEVALFADRSDITEELTRLESHFGQFDVCLVNPEPVGRTLDFLAQEMNREINTIGSKANDAAIAREVVTLKAELERIREQSQNLE
jgi:uncharacterized protein (TIGR00255 family)